MQTRLKIKLSAFMFLQYFIYVDDEVNERIRGAAQGFIAFILWGVGAFVGTLLAGKVLAAHTLAEPTGGLTHDWACIWQIPAWGTVAVLAVLLMFFRDPPRSALPAVISGRREEDQKMP